MKRIEDIEIMEPEELESAALERGIAVPSGLEDRIKAALAAKSALQEQQQPAQSFRWVPYTAAAVAASIVLVAVLSVDRHTPKDTFDNPYLAYKQVEATFGSISEKMSAGALLAGKAEEAADKAIKIVDKITEK